MVPVPLMHAPLNPALYLVTDPEMTARRGLLDTVGAAIAGGVTIVQLRQKNGSARSMVEAGRALKGLLAPNGIPLIVNDRADIAQAIGADGVHVGQDDLAPALARAMLGPDAIIGLSITDGAQLGMLDASVDYVGLGPVFPTGTKPDAAPAIGEEMFAAIRRCIPRPVVAIGGITVANAGRAIAAGADGIAVVSAICAAADPRGAARALRAAVDLAIAARTSGRGRPDLCSRMSPEIAGPAEWPWHFSSCRFAELHFLSPLPEMRLPTLFLLTCGIAGASVPVDLFNGRDLTGWELAAAPATDIAAVCHAADGGVLAVSGTPEGCLLAAGSYENYQLHVEYRWPAAAARNSAGGVLVHVAPGPADGNPWPVSFKIQMKICRAGDLLPIAGAKFAETPSSAPGAQTPQLDHLGLMSEKALGAWNSINVVCRGQTIEVSINGVFQNRITHCEPHAGRVGIQLEGFPFELRNLRLTPFD